MIHGDTCTGELVSRRVGRYVPNLGIDGVEVCGAVLRVACRKCHKVIETVIPSLGELVAAAALARVQVPIKLDNKEIRFLRRTLGWQSKTLAKQLGVTPERVSRWESADKPEPIAPNNEKLFRLFVAQNLKDKAPGVFIDERQILTMDTTGFRKPDEKIKLRFWRVFLKEGREAPPAEVWDIRRTGTDG